VRRLVALLVSLVALSALAGCDAGTPPAAKVGQVEISRATLRSDLEAEAARAEAIHSEDSPAKSVEHTWSTPAAAELLGRRIRYELLGLALKANHLTVADSDRSSAEQSLCSGGGTTTQQTGCPGLKGYPKDYRTFQIELAARGSAYQKFLAANDDVARQKYVTLKASDPDQLEVQCYVGATITDPSTVQTIQLRVAGGQSFEDAVTSVGGAQVQGGQQCLPSSLLPKEVTSADDGTVLGPYSNQSGGQFVVQIKERRTGTYDEVSDLLKQQITTKQQQDAVQKLLDSAKVSVDPRYGHWDRASGAVVPPKGPSSASSTVPAGSSTSG
jgi:hypothetical protein